MAHYDVKRFQMGTVIVIVLFAFLVQGSSGCTKKGIARSENVNLTVTDTEGTPVAGAQVLVIAGDALSPGGMVQTSTNGEIELRNFPAAPFFLGIMRKGFEPSLILIKNRSEKMQVLKTKLSPSPLLSRGTDVQQSPQDGVIIQLPKDPDRVLWQRFANNHNLGSSQVNVIDYNTYGPWRLDTQDVLWQDPRKKEEAQVFPQTKPDVQALLPSGFSYFLVQKQREGAVVDENAAIIPINEETAVQLLNDSKHLNAAAATAASKRPAVDSGEIIHGINRRDIEAEIELLKALRKQVVDAEIQLSGEAHQLQQLSFDTKRKYTDAAKGKSQQEEQELLYKMKAEVEGIGRKLQPVFKLLEEARSLKWDLHHQGIAELNQLLDTSFTPEMEQWDVQTFGPSQIRPKPEEVFKDAQRQIQRAKDFLSSYQARKAG